MAADTDLPTGCLGCNREAVAAVLRERGIDPECFSEVPRPRHAWSDVTTCGECGRAWIANRAKEESDG